MAAKRGAEKKGAPLSTSTAFPPDILALAEKTTPTKKPKVDAAVQKDTEAGKADHGKRIHCHQEIEEPFQRSLAVCTIA